MPEGPEVWELTDHLNRCLSSPIHRIIKEAKIVSGKYTRKGIPGIELLNGATILDISCKGKLITIQIQTQVGERVILSTLGMTGHWHYVLRRLNTGLPKHARLILSLEDYGDLVFVDPRNFGTFTVVDTGVAYKKMNSLGADLMRGALCLKRSELQTFVERVRRYGKTKPIAEVLLDQRVVAGCGNYVRAEAMYFSCTNPLVAADQLSDENLKALWNGLVISVTASSQGVHPYIGGKPFEFTVYGRRTTEDGKEVRSYKDSNGRTVWWVPDVQA